mgnify:CR=1 FL=1
MTLDLLYAALKCSKAVQQRVCNGQIMHNMLMLAVHACFSSQKFGGKLVHKEHVMGGFLTLALTFVMSAGLAGGMEPAKRHFLKGCKGLTHGCLIIYWACFFFYITTFQLGDFPSQNYIACQGRGFCRAKDSVFYDINVFTSSMWFMVNMMTYFMLMSGSDNEQKSFALYRMATVALLQIPLMMSEKAMTVPKEYTNGVVAMSICLTALACAAPEVIPRVDEVRGEGGHAELSAKFESRLTTRSRVFALVGCLLVLAFLCGSCLNDGCDFLPPSLGQDVMLLRCCPAPTCAKHV